MNRVDEMCADPQYHVSMTMRPGDMQFVNNYHVLHARHAYEDDRASGRIRHAANPSEVDPAIRQSRVSGTIDVHDYRVRYQISNLGTLTTRGSPTSCTAC